MSSHLFQAIGVFVIAGSSLDAASFSNVQISFNEPAFPTANTGMTGNQGYNVLNDSTGAKIATTGELGSLVGDQADLLMNFQTTSGALGSSSWQWQTTSSGRFTATNAFAGTVGSNNPGTLNSSTITLVFGNHLEITNLSLSGLSLNTGGAAWEYTVVEFFRPDGSSFSSAPTIGSYLSGTSIEGSPSEGWFVIDNRGTVSGVGTSQTSTGSNGSGDNRSVGYSDAGLSAGNQIGGIRITIFLEDTRGTLNSNSSFTSSFTDFTFSGTIVPEPASALLCAMTGGFCLLRRSRLR